ncbi:MAG: hypothetical protein WCI45_06025, partial [Desulfuromonadales bacterium]
MRIFILISMVMVLLSLSGLSRINAAVLDETIRVAIVKSASEILVGGEGLLVTKENGDALIIAFPVTVALAKDGMLVEG